MKQKELLRHRRKCGCYLKRQGKEHELWSNPQTGHVEAVPRHIEIPNNLARKTTMGLPKLNVSESEGQNDARQD